MKTTEQKLKSRLALLDRFVREARQRLDATPGLSDRWFHNFREWKKLDQQRLQTKVELSITQYQGEL